MSRHSLHWRTFPILPEQLNEHCNVKLMKNMFNTFCLTHLECGVSEYSVYKCFREVKLKGY